VRYEKKLRNWPKIKKISNRLIQIRRQFQTGFNLRTRNSSNLKNHVDRDKGAAFLRKSGKSVQLPCATSAAMPKLRKVALR
jgi:hypothetical protein